MRALTDEWRRLPPPAVQLARIAAFLGLPPATEAKSAPAPPAQDLGEALELFPSGPMPQIMSSAEYLARKAEAHAHQ